MNPLYAAACEYAAEGWPVFPVKGKIPLTSHGLLDATKDPAQIAAWWSRWPDAGIGLPTGRASGVVVVDVDPRHEGEATLAALERTHGDIPYTRTASTGGGGVHFFFRYPEEAARVKSRANVLGQGIDVRGDGGYVVLPPSPHPSGASYVWQDTGAETETMPDWVLAGCLQEARSVPEGVPGVPGDRIPEGQRDDSLARLAGKLRRAGLEPEEIEASLAKVNERLCVPPLPSRDIARIAQSIGRREGDPVHVAGQGSAMPALLVVPADELDRMVLPPREYILSPVLREKNIAMIFAERGMGKTIVAAGWALAIAGGTQFLRWSAPKPRRVLYVDGELPVETIQARIRLVAESAKLPIPPTLGIINPDLQPGTAVMPNLADLEGRARLMEAIDAFQPEVVILDNVSTLVRGGEENDAESWQPVQDFLLMLRTRRISTLMVHHTGKGGTQRGTSKREDVIDLSVQLSRPEGYTADQGARMLVTYTKARDPHGEAVRPFEAWLFNHDGDGQSWQVSSPGTTDDLEKVQRLITVLPMTEAEAVSGRKLEQLAGLKNGSSVALLQRLKNEGVIQSKSASSGAGTLWWAR